MAISRVIPLLVFVALTWLHVDGTNTEKVEVTAEPSATSRGALGKGFLIHKMDLLTRQLKGTGADIFEELPLDECVISDKLGTIERDDSYYSDTKSLYKSVSSNTKVEGSLEGAYTLGASVGAVTNNIASSEEQVQGVSLNLKSYGLSSGLKATCINEKPLAKKFVEDFEALGAEVNNPYKKSSWKKYDAFLEKYGTHFVKESISGSSIYQYVFAKASKKFSQEDFTVTACLSLAGPTQAGEAKVSACSEVSRKETSNSKSSSMIKKLVIRGGSAETRANLNGELSADQINKFLQEGATDPMPIEYKFKSIAGLLKTRYVGTEHYAKAANLDQYYNGYLHFGCSKESTENAGGKEIVMQKFDHAKDSEPDSPTYECKIYAEGCHHNEDCHYRAAFWCECGGPYPKARSCLRHKTSTLAAGSDKKSVFLQTAHSWGWHGCQLKGFSCWCTDERTQWTKTWSGEEKDQAMRDYHIMVMARKRRDQAAKRSKHHKKQH